MPPEEDGGCRRDGDTRCFSSPLIKWRSSAGCENGTYVDGMNMINKLWPTLSVLATKTRHHSIRPAARADWSSECIPRRQG